MKTDGEIKDDIYRIIVGSELAKAITGEVLKTKRPHNSELEDIVISVLANGNAQKQVATVNVNIYVPEKDIEGQYEEDTERTKELSKLAEKLFDVFRTDEYHGHLLEQRGYEVDGAAVWVINNKIEYKLINE